MPQDRIDAALAYVQGLFETEYSGHDYFHTLRVFNMATRLAKAEGADVEIAQLAALLHDVDDRKLSPETHKTQDRARAFLRELGVEEPAIERICCIIREISFGDNGTTAPSTPEGRCVQDADRLDALGAIGIARAFAYGGHHRHHMHHPDIAPQDNMTCEEYRQSQSTTVNHFYEKLFKLTALMNTETAIRIASEREALMRAYLDAFLGEWEGKR